MQYKPFREKKLRESFVCDTMMKWLTVEALNAPLIGIRSNLWRVGEL